MFCLPRNRWVPCPLVCHQCGLKSQCGPWYSLSGSITSSTGGHSLLWHHSQGSWHLLQPWLWEYWVVSPLMATCLWFHTPPGRFSPFCRISTACFSYTHPLVLHFLCFLLLSSLGQNQDMFPMFNCLGISVQFFIVFWGGSTVWCGCFFKLMRQLPSRKDHLFCLENCNYFLVRLLQISLTVRIFLAWSIIWISLSSKPVGIIR